MYRLGDFFSDTKQLILCGLCRENLHTDKLAWAERVESVRGVDCYLPNLTFALPLNLHMKASKTEQTCFICFLDKCEKNEKTKQYLSDNGWHYFVF